MVENTLILFEKNKFPVLMCFFFLSFFNFFTKPPTVVEVQKYFVIREKVKNYSWSSDLFLT